METGGEPPFWDRRPETGKRGRRGGGDMGTGGETPPEPAGEDACATRGEGYGIFFSWVDQG